MIVGTLGTALLAHRLLGFRPTAHAGRQGERDLAQFVGQLESQVVRMEKHLLQSELIEERTAVRLEETEQEVRQLRASALKLDKRLNDANESRRLREREMARRQERELERHRERELEESTWQFADAEGPVVTG
ncbi:MAG: hypothetical protein JSS68_19845 [Actinobacteria bacterium]|nr:hypothetical protein [Actinomycetota bacterium]